MISRVKQDYAKLEENLKQVREHQREADQERERITEDLQSIRKILNGRPSSNLTAAAYNKVHRLLSLPNSREER
jgi:septation ring formation regulator EzrA